MERIDIVPDFQDHVGAKDLPNVRYLEFNNGNKLNLKRADPFGFWYVSFDKGQVPESLKSAFTTVEDALKAIQTYLNGKNYVIKKDTTKG